MSARRFADAPGRTSEASEVFIRYSRDKKGKLVEKALVYTESEHGIRKSMIDPDALRIIERLKAEGHQAYIVGGAVRDLVQGKSPKDFDLVTDALPNKIKRLFRSARVIGRRFRLVHIMAGGKLFEVSTFRSNKNGSVGNEFGTMDEDVLRRDFTFNALYLDPTDLSLVDFVGGYKDLRAAKVKPIIPLGLIFKEDPVRIVRCIKYGVSAGFAIPFNLRRAIRRDSRLLADVSSSRMTEEFFKILACGKAEKVFRALVEFRILQYFVPSVWARMRDDIAYANRLFADLESLDAMKLELGEDMGEKEGAAQGPGGKSRTLSVILSYFLKSFLFAEKSGSEDSGEKFRESLLAARAFIQPLNPPRVDLEAAVLMIFRNSGISPLQKPKKSRRRAKTGAKKPTAACQPADQQQRLQPEP
ncbi:MAG: polynucleotide adenylyltransferase PcnB [Spirochaetia bacterium]|jgi:poly(A) polymerase|nr:polynucleotide adenylyltransferase PcnB [Spirochaetia bacterium]